MMAFCSSDLVHRSLSCCSSFLSISDCLSAFMADATALWNFSWLTLVIATFCKRPTSPRRVFSLACEIDSSSLAALSL